MAISIKPRTGVFKPLARLSSREMDKIALDCKNPRRASAALKARIAAAKLTVKERTPA